MFSILKLTKTKRTVSSLNSYKLYAVILSIISSAVKTHLAASDIFSFYEYLTKLLPVFILIKSRKEKGKKM